jgi:FkbM family methyltransferase
MAKPEGEEVSKNEHNQVYWINRPISIILPSVNLEYYCANGLFESGLIDWAKQLCGKTRNFLDIGAHTGTYSLCLAQYCNQVYSFEPQKMTYYALCGGVALSNKHNITCYNIALGSEDQEGEMMLKIVSNDGGGSTLHRGVMDEPVLMEEKVVVRTLDSMDIDNVGLIKMDVEDNELYVLKGATKTLEKSGYPKILFESNRDNRALFEYLQTEIGYKVIQITGVSNMFLAEK